MNKKKTVLHFILFLYQCTNENWSKETEIKLNQYNAILNSLTWFKRVNLTQL